MQKVNEGNMNSVRESGLGFFFFFPRVICQEDTGLLTGNQESSEDVLVSFLGGRRR